MPESVQHRKLIDRMEAWVYNEFSHYRWLSVLTDKFLYPGESDSPPNINGCIPDLYATDVPETFCIVGEAKTTKDLMTKRSLRQILVFLNYIAIKPGNNFFILGVPYNATNQAKTIIRNNLHVPNKESLGVFILNEIDIIKINMH